MNRYSSGNHFLISGLEEPHRRRSFRFLQHHRHPCPKCDKSYVQKGHLTRHLKYECGIDKKLECFLCMAKFRYPTDMKNHIMKRHRKQM